MSQHERRPSVAEVKAKFEAMEKAANHQANNPAPPPQSQDPQTSPFQPEKPTTTTVTTTGSLYASTDQKITNIANAVRERNLAARPDPPADFPTGYENATSFQGRFDHQSRKDGCPAFWPPDQERRLRRKSGDDEGIAEDAKESE